MAASSLLSSRKHVCSSSWKRHSCSNKSASVRVGCCRTQRSGSLECCRWYMPSGNFSLFEHQLPWKNLCMMFLNMAMNQLQPFILFYKNIQGESFPATLQAWNFWASLDLKSCAYCTYLCPCMLKSRNLCAGS